MECQVDFGGARGRADMVWEQSLREFIETSSEAGVVPPVVVPLDKGC
jgi:hypothetical protein